MENFVVSARKYRPATFDTVVGQASITNTLKNAIKNNHLAQAFLFCGPRGVGKTTCARILAKTINCFHVTSTIEACDECESCKSFNVGHSLNVYELDAASNNSVDDIRSLVDQVRFAPQLGKYKVYIIDEVHMLSQAAFNAFLKTLEEPPKHAIFILATTEKHKIIPTILSRCQIFDFNRIQINDIAKHLQFIAQKENITAEPDALHVIAQKADGALRDALSIFDQIVSFAGNNITYKAVIENLNVLDYDYYFNVIDAILKKDIPQCLLIFNEVLSNGFDGHNFIAGLAEHMRNLLVCKDVATLQLLDVGDNIREKYKQQATASPMLFLVNSLTLVSKADMQYKTTKSPRLLVELTLMQLCSGISSDAEKKNDISIPAPAKQQAPVVEKSTPAVPVQPELAKPTATSAPVKAAVVEPAPAPQEAASSKKPMVRLATTSISKFAEQPKKVENNGADNLTQPSGPAENFTQQDLEKAWNQYIQKLDTQGKKSLAVTLRSGKPLLTDSFVVKVAIENKVQEQNIIDEKAELLGFIRDQLKNYKVSLETVIDVSDSTNKLYTATDKFKHMAEKNPTINKLRQQFDLEIDL